MVPAVEFFPLTRIGASRQLSDLESIQLQPQLLLRRERAVHAIATAAVVSTGAMLAWSGRYFMNQDGITYLDLADAWLRRDVSMMTPGYWSPLYSWLLALVLKLSGRNPAWEFQLAHLVNFMWFLFSLGTFRFFWNELIARDDDLESALPRGALWAVGYGLFLWTVVLINLSNVTPDICVAAVVYLAAGLLLRLRTRTSWTAYVAFGLTLAIGFHAKGVMLPMAMVLFAIAVLICRRRAGVALAFLVFVTACTPFVVMMSRAKGKFSVGDSGRLAYIDVVYPRIEYLHWQGEPAGSGLPVHPVRKLMDAPAVYEFNGPVGGTYPPWYDPSYWNEGANFSFNLRAQLSTIIKSLFVYLKWFFFVQPALLAGWLTMIASGARWRSAALRHWPLLIFCGAALGLYGLVWAEPRYVGAYFVILWGVFFTSLRWRNESDGVPIATYVAVAISLAIAIGVVGAAADSMTKPVATSELEPLVAAQALGTLGIGEHSAVSVIGDGSQAYWARLARVRVVAEVPGNEATRFWASAEDVQNKTIAALGRSGAQIVVAQTPPADAVNHGWKRLGATHYFYLLLSR